VTRLLPHCSSLSRRMAHCKANAKIGNLRTGLNPLWEIRRFWSETGLFYLHVLFGYVSVSPASSAIKRQKGPLILIIGGQIKLAVTNDVRNMGDHLEAWPIHTMGSKYTVLMDPWNDLRNTQLDLEGSSFSS
jgi:hypothetical protein